ncbi:hypothetical protein UC34_20345 [Pandoraea vervacti]|uniref:Uncharacterized protein n=1 Tax=Pandoraea vervacti TaxID=656178 RepID=A0ABM5T1M1_9BURK|nr:hypothetical protein UC34_20345 [Pandoraea vervacti]
MASLWRRYGVVITSLWRRYDVVMTSRRVVVASSWHRVMALRRCRRAAMPRRRAAQAPSTMMR